MTFLDELIRHHYTYIRHKAMGNYRMASETGIERAVQMHGTQSLFAEQLSAKLGKTVAQSRVSTWLANGYVPTERAQAVSDITGIPLTDLIRKTKRTRRISGRAAPSA